MSNADADADVDVDADASTAKNGQTGEDDTVGASVSIGGNISDKASMIRLDSDGDAWPTELAAEEESADGADAVDIGDVWA